ncbi:restriction endonuclease subunit R [bacterium]|nr:restriction endonuclease subunit R [bacterium]
MGAGSGRSGDAHRAKLALGPPFVHLCAVEFNLPGFPVYDLRQRQRMGRAEVFDPVRKKFVALTPEERVRQHLLRYFEAALGYPTVSMAVEWPLNIHGLTKRADVVVFRQGVPVLLAECKAPGIPLNESVLDQAEVYNRGLGVRWMVLTNGTDHHVAYKKEAWQWAERFPTFQEL